MMQFVRDSDAAVGAIIAGAGSRPAEELVTALRKGGYLRKYGRRGKPKLHWFRLSHDDKELLWDSSNGKIRSIPLLSVSNIVQGQTTAVFKREPLPDYEAVSFSLLYSEGKSSAKERSLDVVCRNMQEFETWFLGIQLVIVLNQNLALQQHLAAANGQVAAAVQAYASGSSSATPSRQQSSQTMSPRRSDDKIQEFKQIAASLQPVKAALSGASQRSTSAQLAALLKREIGDCYIWGSWCEAEACPLDFCEGTLQCSALPTMVANTHALDIIQVSVGARHAALLTRGGEVYTWGAGLGGNMGNGTGCSSNYPQQVTRLASKGTAAVACGHSYTAAVLSDGSLYTWGSGLGGQLGLGPNVTAAVWPTRIYAGLEGVRVSQVSCGPYHAALIGSDGRLFTWGDGLFGKLGHGDHCSAHSPRFVTTLAEHWVISVSCGWWHTAAAAVARSRLTNRATQSSTSLDSYVSDADSVNSAINRTASNSGSFLHGNILGSSSVPPAVTAAAAAGSTRDATAASVLASRATDMGGAIFTWGGDFRWQQHWAKDNHQGCLGVGDLNGRLVPTLVKGEDNHVQVACGRHFTVALTNNGEVYQMGNTGAQNNREKDKADWKSALVPVLVRGLLVNHIAEQLACGMSHVAVVATQRMKTHSSNGSTPVTRLLTWGKNTAGQLGIGAGRDDHFMPQVVSAVAGRRILFLACGGNYTLAVCEHDPRARWSRDSIDHDSLATAPSGSLVSSSGPSRLHLAGVALTPTGSSGVPGAPGDRGLAPGGISGAAGHGLVGGQRSMGAGGLTVSTSYASLASSGQSGSRGEAPAVGSGGGAACSARKSDRGRLEARHSDRGFPVHAVHGNNGGREHHHHPQQHQLLSTKSMGLLTRSLDRSLGGLGLSAGGAGPQASQQQQGVGGCESRTVSWAPSPTDSSRSLRGLGSHSGRNLGISLSSGPSMVGGNNGNSSGLQLQDLSLQALASASKRHHLLLPKSFKKLAMGRSDSNNSSSRHTGWSDWQNHSQGLRGPGVSAGTPKEQWTLQGRSSSRQLSYSARSEPDLATVSATSSMTSAALSMTPSPSIPSLQEGRAADAAGDLGTPGADTVEWQRQLRYWQERAATMEQQLSRRTHEVETLRRELRFSSTSQGTTSDTQQHYSCSSLRPRASGDRHSSGGGAGAGADGVSSSNLAVRRGLQPLAPVTAVQSIYLDDGSSSTDQMAQSSASSIPRMGPLTGSASATPVDLSSGASSGAAAGAALGAALGFGAGAAAAGQHSPVPAVKVVPPREVHKQLDEQQEPLLQSLGNYPLPLKSSQQHTSPSSPSSSMEDAREDWCSPVDEVAAAEVSKVPEDRVLQHCPSVASTEGSVATSATSTLGTGSPVLHRGTSLANWIGGDTGRAALLRSRATSLANSGAASTSSAGAGDDSQQQQQQQQQQHVVGVGMPQRRSTGESFVFSQVERIQQQQGQQQQGQQHVQQLQQVSLSALREAASVSSEDDVPAVANGSGQAQNHIQQQRQRHSHKHEPPDEEQQLQQQVQDMFRSMSEHSKEASRVLALFQESQRHRQQLEQQQQQPGEAQEPSLPPSADMDGVLTAQRLAHSSSNASAVAAEAPKFGSSSGADSKCTRSESEPPGDVQAAVVAAGPVLPLDVDAAAGEVAMSPAALVELELLRQQNRALQQQLQKLQQQSPQPPQPPAPVAAVLPAPVTVVAAGRTSLGPSSAGAGSLSSSLGKHRKTLSVDIGSNSAITHEVAKGVYLSLQALPDGAYELKRVRFAKQIFSSGDAEQWWAANRDRVYAAFKIRQQQQQHAQSAPLRQQGHQSPEPPQQQQQQGAAAGGGSSKMRVSLVNPHPLGPLAANVPTLCGLRELRVKSRSSNGDWTPQGTSCVNSPQSSMLELDTLQLPPSMFLDASPFVAATQVGPGPWQEQQQQQQVLPQQQPEQQQQQPPRGWAAVAPTGDAAMSRRGNVGSSGLIDAPAGAGSAPGPLQPDGVTLDHRAGDGLTPTTCSGTPASDVAEAGWQPVLPRKGSLGPAAAGPDTPTAAGAVAAAASSHKRSSSGLFRWLSKDKVADDSLRAGQ